VEVLGVEAKESMHRHDFIYKPQDCTLIAISGQYDIYCLVGNFNALAHASIRLKAIESSAKICRS